MKKQVLQLPLWMAEAGLGNDLLNSKTHKVSCGGSEQLALPTTASYNLEIVGQNKGGEKIGL